MTIRDNALKWLYRELKATKIALGHAETRPGVTQKELDCLRSRIETIEWITPLVLKAEEE